MRDHPTAGLVPYIHASSAALLALLASRSGGAVRATLIGFASIVLTSLACIGNAYTPVAIGRLLCNVGYATLPLSQALAFTEAETNFNAVSRLGAISAADALGVSAGIVLAMAALELPLLQFLPESFRTAVPCVASAYAAGHALSLALRAVVPTATASVAATTPPPRPTPAVARTSARASAFSSTAFYSAYKSRAYAPPRRSEAVSMSAGRGIPRGRAALATLVFSAGAMSTGVEFAAERLRGTATLPAAALHPLFDNLMRLLLQIGAAAPLVSALGEVGGILAGCLLVVFGSTLGAMTLPPALQLHTMLAGTHLMEAS